ncbi:MAG: signal peptide peptidase SppA [Bacteroidaceae bacterium]|nr:signal peptide peptidase SppA [Bacteroidaceae bacterium]
MKQFLKYVLATVLGLVVAGLLMGFFSMLMFMGMAMGTSAPKVEKNSVLVMKLDGTLSERTEENPFDMLMGGAGTSALSLENMLKAVEQAKENENVKGLYMEAGMLSAASPAMLQELRDAIVDFKESGKFVLSYGDTYTQGAYYLCSAADSVVVNPQGVLDWHGMSMQTMFFKEILDKLGVNVQVFKVGTYKSAVEPFIGTEMSDANREQMEVFTSEIWNEMLVDVSESRKISVEELNQVADTVTMLCETSFYLDEKLVDKVAYSDEIPQMICNMMDVDDEDDYNTITVDEMASVASNKPKDDSGNIVAVYYAYGDIVNTPSSGISSEEIASSVVIRDLEKLADDDDVKAVVLRVNSGGGSAYASEQIWHQVMNIKSKKPIVVSMGGMAASGGYYISCAADYIFAEPTTLTGSIGIFGMIPEVSELVTEKIGLHSETVKTNKFADFGDLTRPMNENEKAVMQASVNRGYELFTKRCADGRGMEQDSIKAVAEGRVWTGLHALELGLVDQLGGLDDAIAEAKKRAEIEACTVKTYPGTSSFIEKLSGAVGGDSYADAKMKEILGDYYGTFSYMKRMATERGVMAKSPYTYRFGL